MLYFHVPVEDSTVTRTCFSSANVISHGNYCEHMSTFCALPKEANDGATQNVHIFIIYVYSVYYIPYSLYSSFLISLDLYICYI